MKRGEKKAKILEFFKNNPKGSYIDAAVHAECTVSYVKLVMDIDKEQKAIVQKHYPLPKEPKADNVNHPAHYKVGGIETIDFIEAKGLNYNLGNVVKYITRSDHKGNRAEDLAKARWYLNRELAKLQK